jgi:Response regulator containing CheY-like receiver domain and AraC-type DNA-binding domain
VRELQPLIQVAFLSGYDDFEYARSAIDNRVIAYLLKPISMAELTENLRTIHARMEDRFHEFLPDEQDADLSLAVSSLLLDGFPEQSTEEERQRLLRNCGLDFNEPDQLTVLASVPKSGELPQNAAQVVDKMLRRTYGCASFVSGRRIFSLLISKEGFERLNETLDELYYLLKRIWGTDCTLGVSRPFDRLERCSAACREAVDAARLSDDTGIRYIGRLQGMAEEQKQDEQQMSIQFDRLLFSGDRAGMEAFLGGCLGPQTGEINAMQVLIVCQGILRSALGEETVSLLLRRFGLQDPLSAGLGAEEFRRRIIELCLEGQFQLTQNSRGSMGRLVDRALRMIDQRYMEEDLSLNSVSEELHVSPNYLSANMKKYAGDTFINLLIQKRMEAAKILISARNLKIGEIAEKCGYSDQHYFSFCFKKYYGISPAKMRRGEEEDA